jgi:16S rRNA A1518/A1519 N6-dimethyltransferase RsmA/KsgA/DIM1 with predicted DNA glycosylase/AP lyase activity
MLAQSPPPTVHVLTLVSARLLAQRFDALLRVCFLRKNKTLRALLTSRTARVVYELNIERLPFTNGHDTSNEDARVTAACEAALAACALSTSRAVQVPVAQFLMLQHELQTRGVALRPSDTRHFRD